MSRPLLSPLVWLSVRRFLGLCFSPFFDPAQLMRPEAFKRLCPLIQRPDSLGVRSIQHLSPIPAHPHQTNLPQHPQVLRNRRLFQPEAAHDGAHRPFLASQVIQNLPPPRFSHRIKSIRSSRRPCHPANLYSHIGICQAHRSEYLCHPERSKTDRAAIHPAESRDPAFLSTTTAAVNLF